MLSASLSKDLRERYGARSLPVRKGDTVKIVRGDFTGIEGKVTEVDTGGSRIYVEGVTREKVSGTSTKVAVHSSKVMITNLNLDDRWRSKSLEEERPAAVTEKVQGVAAEETSERAAG